jgi:amino acid transporter
MELAAAKKPGLFTAVGIGVGCMIGSGWLFAAYYAAQYVGPASFLSWLIGAGLALVLALLLAEIASIFKEKALFSRLLSVSHKNQDLSFVIAISGWLGLVIVIPSEASATIQYLSTAIPSLSHYLVTEGQHTLLGSFAILVLIFIYTLINYWGIKSLAKASNVIAIIKIAIPILTSIILMITAFHTSNFAMSPDIKTTRILSAVVVCGIFYAFYGFAMVAMYSTELENPRKNIPLALILSVVICLGIYLLLQAAFIGALPVEMVAKGWSKLNFTSPLAQLLLMFNINFLVLWSIILYADSAVSPSGTGILYMGSASRTLTGMAQDRQAPAFFHHTHPIYNLSRRSLLFTTLVCALIIIFFKNWQEIMIVVTVFQLISCVAIPIAFIKLRLTQPDKTRAFSVRYGIVLSYLIYIMVSYLLIQATVVALVLALILHIVFFLFYACTYYKWSGHQILNAFMSSWSIFVYIIAATIFGYLRHEGWVGTPIGFMLFITSFSLILWALLEQKNFNCNSEG